MRKPVHSALLTLTASLMALPTLAQDPGGFADEEYFLDDVPVVLSATRLAQAQYETPASVTVIDRDMIRASGALDIPDLLRLVPGFQVARARIHTISATYHGLADERARRMQVLVDGRPVYGPSTGGVRWMELPLDISDVERIEVIRGPNAAAYGANAFLGAINIITRHPAQALGTGIEATLGNKGNRKFLVRHGTTSDRGGIRLTLSWREDDGFEPRRDLAPPEPGSTSRDPRVPLADGMRFPLFDMRAEYRISNVTTIEFLGGYNGGIRREGNYDDLIDKPRKDRISSHFQQIILHHSPAEDRETRIQIYHTYMRNSSTTVTAIPDAYITLLGLTPGASITTDFGIAEQRLEAELEHHRTVSDRLRYVLGGSARLDRVRGRNWYSREDYIENRLYRLFGNMEYRPYPEGVLNAGLMIEKSSQIGTRLSPRIAFNHQVTPRHGLRASISRAYRLPTIHEEHIDGSIYLPDGTLFDQVFLGNPDLSPERITSIELGYLGRLSPSGITLDVKLFQETLQDRIVGAKNWPVPYELYALIEAAERGYTSPRPRAIRFTNTPDESRTRGIEFSLAYRPGKHDMLLFNWSFADIDGQVLKDYAYSPDNPAAWEFLDIDRDVPLHTYSLFLMHRFPGQLDVSALYHHTDRVRWLGDGDYLGPQDRLDVRIAKGFLFDGGSGEAALVFQNVLDEYLEFRDENVFDTRVYAQVSMDFY